jgi:hypothetical protein
MMMVKMMMTMTMTKMMMLMTTTMMMMMLMTTMMMMTMKILMMMMMCVQVGYSKLVSVLSYSHQKDERHKTFVGEAIDLIVQQLGKSLTPGEYWAQHVGANFS